jgi:hypothetical protein
VTLEDTAELPILPVVQTMREQPGSMLLFVGEVTLMALMTVGLLTVVFLLCLGGYVLVAKAPG